MTERSECLGIVRFHCNTLSAFIQMYFSVTVGLLLGVSRFITMKPRGFTARFTCRALSTARQGLFYTFTFSPFTTLFKQRQKQGGPPLYVERSEAQQLCCSVFSLLRMAGEWVSSSISRGVGNTVTLLFCFLIYRKERKTGVNLST